MLSVSMDFSRGSGILLFGGVFKNSFSVYFLVIVVLIIILGYGKDLRKRM